MCVCVCVISVIEELMLQNNAMIEYALSDPLKRNLLVIFDFSTLFYSLFFKRLSLRLQDLDL